ncbi:hypothetical protein LJB84_01430 [Bacteroidales bacterium OttesenSCG-928-J19]|nr:hypothetical protein [Bacteroidales bacterium OttesenSCG-928-J19]
MSTKKKITRIEKEGGVSTPREQRAFVPTAESKGKATNLRVIAGVLWFLAIAAQIGAIVLVLRPPINMLWIILLIVADLILASVGGILWKKSNRFDPASEKDKFRFFMQSQLGLVIAIVAFLPLVVVILSNKNLDGKQKGILAGVAGVALVIAGLIGTDFNPPSVEQYTEETSRVEWLNEGVDNVYWTKSGKVYHLYSDCSYINTDRTDEIFEGTVVQSHEANKITKLCSRCENRAVKERNLNEADYVSTIESVTTPEESEE